MLYVVVSERGENVDGKKSKKNRNRKKRSVNGEVSD